MNIFNHTDLNKLYHKEDSLEKSISNVIKRFPESEQHFSNNISFYKNSCENRSKELEAMHCKIRSIMYLLKLKTDLLRNKRLEEITDFNEFKQEMIGIQDNITSLKETSKRELQNIRKASEDLNDELKIYYNEKLDEWNQSYNVTTNLNIYSKVKTKTQQSCKEVKTFLDFVYQSGGCENGWSKEDHLIFLKYRARYKNISDTAIHLHEQLPDISVEQIKAHYEWHNKYLELESQKKKAIQIWKDKKNLQKFKNNFNPNSNSVKLSVTNPLSNNEKIREKLQHWKNERDQKLIEEKQQERQRLLEQIEKERAERQKQLETKQLVGEWKESKMAFEQYQRKTKQLEEDNERKRRAMLANRLIKKFQSLDELHILKMRQVHQKANKQLAPRAQSGPIVRRDPRRVMQPTIQWVHKVKSLNEGPTGLVPIIASSKLAIPDWRKNLF
ncbi:coiled-coil domain-containing protein 112-like [Rhynchophorus ferrugineus]|uniref:coiled-coil domain-containing protein 112-like n=1 Tax=Rhynchophorus ferrugineus TaxID=354439 RepID=UPI003FCCE6A5